MKTNFKFDNSYTQLTSMMMSKIMPVKVKLPKLVLLNHAKNRNNVKNMGGLINLCKQGRQIHFLKKDFNKIH